MVEKLCNFYPLWVQMAFSTTNDQVGENSDSAFADEEGQKSDGHKTRQNQIRRVASNGHYTRKCSPLNRRLVSPKKT